MIVKVSGGLRPFSVRAWALFAAGLVLAGAVHAQTAAGQTASAAAAGPAAPPAVQLPSQTPVAAFFSRPQIEAVRLSPSGRWLAVSTATGLGRVGVAIFDLQTLQPVAVPARFSDVDIDEVDWVNDEMLVFSIQDNQRGGADQRYWPGLFLCTATAKVRSDSW